MTIRHLKIFVTVSDLGSVTKAAEKLYVSQPSISVAIKNLEEYYNVKLFERLPRKLMLTEAGKSLLEQARHIISLYDDMEKGALDWDELGLLKIGSSITIGNFLIPGYVKEMKKRHKDMKISVFINSSNIIQKMILSNEIDIALIEGIPDDKSIKAVPFMDDELVVICGTDHELTKKKSVTVYDLVDNDFILREKGSGTREFFNSALLVKEQAVEPIWESISTQAIVTAVNLGLGISVLPKRLVENDINDGRVCRVFVEDLVLNRKFFIIHHKNKYMTKAINEFINVSVSGNYKQ